MQDLDNFHRVVGELLKHIGMPGSGFVEGQEMLTLDVDQRYTLHFGHIDREHCFVLVDLSAALPAASEAVWRRLLQANQIGPRRWQPVLALDEQDRLTMWLRLPLSGSTLPQLLEAFDGLLAEAAALWLQLTAPASGPGSAGERRGPPILPGR
ncbi:CesT family type III secretion system chaperone [Paludibacterium sp. B53371]|uniref:CesT family type III secretion system chaperone n=1 Tax=Paludibacterium sp. B53371 TaxID=2806263 RepID=UPI001C051CDA|nr:CesT family type III secretion system chaperone [Paludibacterium sp. B53371]